MRLAIAAFALIFSVPAMAADGAKFRAIGFSKDSNFFAFEQYGVQDGSGFSYADIFVLDIKADDWFKGTPVKTLLEDETGDVSAVRAKAKVDAGPALDAAKIDTDAEILAANPFTELVADRTRVTFHDHYNNAMGVFGNADNQGSWSLEIVPIKVPVNGECEPDIETFGYKLSLTNKKTGQTAFLHVDKEVPKSRFCPVAYDIEAVVQPVGAPGQIIAIIGVSRRGFEGADRRFIALPFTYN